MIFPAISAFTIAKANNAHYPAIVNQGHTEKFSQALIGTGPISSFRAGGEVIGENDPSFLNNPCALIQYLAGTLLPGPFSQFSRLAFIPSRVSECDLMKEAILIDLTNKAAIAIGYCDGDIQTGSHQISQCLAAQGIFINLIYCT